MPWQYLIGADTRVPDECHRPVIVQPSTLHMLRRVLGNDATPKSPEQAQILQLVLDRQLHVVATLPTGGGKSILYQVPALCESSGMTVCIFPFRALTQDQILQAHELGISVATWPEYHSESSDEEDPIYAQYIPINPDQTQLICVSAHYAGRAEFLTFLKALLKAGLLNRVVVDEVHTFLTSQYRSCIPNVRKIQQVGVQVVCLSGSLTPPAVPSLIDFFGFPPSLLRTIRADTPRPSISYHTVQVTEDELFAAVVQEIEDFPLEPEERGLIFCNSYRDCEELSRLTGIPVYYGRLDENQKDRNAEMWRSGQIQRLICTSGFGNGVNHPHVRHVIHLNHPKRMERYAQETGRSGRDGKKSRAVMFYTEVPSAHNVEPPDAAGELAMSRYLSRQQQCKRIEQSRWLDGENRVHSCSSLPSAELCDWCLVSTSKDFFFSSINLSKAFDAPSISSTPITRVPFNVPQVPVSFVTLVQTFSDS
jgi:superfamily II DNA helicase RecQ